VPDKQPNNTPANIPTPKHAPVGAGKAVPAFPSPSAKGIVSSGKATPANASIPGKGAPSVAQTSPANPAAAGSSQVIDIVLQLLFCNALHGADCTAEIVRYLIPVVCQCAGHDGGLASAHACCYTTCPNSDTCLRHISHQSVVPAVKELLRVWRLPNHTLRAYWPKFTPHALA